MAKTHSDAVKAAAKAMLLAGEAPDSVGKQLKVPKQTISRWKTELEAERPATDLPDRRRERITNLLATHLETSLETLNHLLHAVQNDSCYESTLLSKSGFFSGLSPTRAFDFLRPQPLQTLGLSSKRGSEPETPTPELSGSQLSPTTLSTRRKSKKHRELEADWKRCVTTLFPKYFKADFAIYHEEFWEWVWDVEKGRQPQTFVAIWPRGGAKSTSTELACVMLGARQARKYVLYVCETQEQADDHVANIANMLESPEIAEWYPELAAKYVGKFGQSKGWRRNRVRTAGGLTIDALGLDTAARGKKVDEDRPDLIVLDDIDGEHDTPAITKKKIRTITRKLLPAGSPDMAVLAVQNLVHRTSVFSLLASGKADFLYDRKVSGPFPAIENLQYRKLEDGRYEITGGRATWPAGMGIKVCQEKIDDFGMESFMAECQHAVAQATVGAIYPEYSEPHHVITWSEFAEFFKGIARDADGNPRIPLGWTLGRGQDWGTTVGHPCVTVWCARPRETDPLSDCIFIYRELVRPEFPQVVGQENEPVSAGRIAKLINRHEDAWRERHHVKMSLMSHEATAALNTYVYDLPEHEKLHFEKWEPDRVGGIPQVQNYLAIDRELEHPFRPMIKGRPRLFLIVDDEEGKLYSQAGEWVVVPPQTERGLVRLRSEFPAYHYPATVSGDERNYPYNLFNDAMDALRGLAGRFFPQIKPMSAAERRQAKFSAENPTLTLDAIAAESDAPTRDGLLQERMLKLQEKFGAELERRAGKTLFSRRR